MAIVFWNGKFCSLTEVKIPLNDRGFLFGDGVFSTICVENGRPIALQNHLKKLQLQCKLLKIECPLVDAGWLDRLIQSNNAHTGLWRLKIMLTGGEEDTLHLNLHRKGQLIITLKPYQGIRNQAVRLEEYPFPFAAPLANVKSLSLIQRLHIKEYAKEHGAYDCLVKNAQGYILETAFANIFWIQGSRLYIPDPSLFYYFGVTLERIIAEAKHFSISYVKAHQIPSDANPFICNSMIGICPVFECGFQLFERDASLQNRLNI